MKKDNEDAKQKFFEMMGKINPDFKNKIENEIKLPSNKRKRLNETAYSSHYKKPEPPSVELDVEYNEDVTGSGQKIPFTIHGILLWTDQGIGSYEFWGAKGTDIQMAWEVKDFNLKEGTYDKQYMTQINNWINQHEEEIGEHLMDVADEKELYNEFNKYPDEPDFPDTETSQPNLDDIIKEEIALFEAAEILGLKELAELGARLGGYDESIYLEAFQDGFRSGGDDEVVKLAQAMTGQNVYTVSRGKYCFTPVY